MTTIVGQHNITIDGVVSGPMFTCEEDGHTEPFGMDEFLDANAHEAGETLDGWVRALVGLAVGEEITLEWPGVTMRRVQ